MLILGCGGCLHIYEATKYELCVSQNVLLHNTIHGIRFCILSILFKDYTSSWWLRDCFWSNVLFCSSMGRTGYCTKTEFSCFVHKLFFWRLDLGYPSGFRSERWAWWNHRIHHHSRHGTQQHHLLWLSTSSIQTENCWQTSMHSISSLLSLSTRTIIHCLCHRLQLYSSMGP